VLVTGACTGTSMTDEQWSDPTMHAIAVYLDGTDAPDDADDGTPLLDDDFLILVNAYWDEVTFTRPPVRESPQSWFVELDSYDPAVSAARVPQAHRRHGGGPPPLGAGPARPKVRRISRTEPCSASPAHLKRNTAGGPPPRVSVIPGDDPASPRMEGLDLVTMPIRRKQAIGMYHEMRGAVAGLAGRVG
jgi:hypothetical protein